MRSGAGPSQHGRIRCVRENGTYRATRSVSRPSSGGSVPPSPVRETDLRQPTRVASTAPAPPAAQDPPLRSPIATPAPDPSVVGAMGCGECLGGSAPAVRSGLGGADRVCRRMIPRGRPSTHTTTECPSVRAPHAGAARRAHSTHHARGRAAHFPPVLPRIGEYSRSTRAAPPPTALQPSRGLQQPSAMVLPPEYRPLRCCHCLPAPCQRPERHTTHARSPTAPSTPMLRLVRRIARCR
jgi:hypothetical protein